ncbi:putative lipid II flippase FtsW [Candidatus Dependentiae bacterium]|nr:MAG: putative lipid II flippase FtsW [Candidatus Dependentiae bacterium]
MFWKKKELLSDLRIFLGVIVTLIIIGMIFIYSASSVFALEQFGSANYFVKKQVLGLFLGLCGLIAARLIPLEIVKKLAPFIFLITLGVTALTLFPYFTHTVHGSSRWIRIGWITFQPSEFLKIALLVYLAYFLTQKKQTINAIVHTFLPFLIILGLPCFVLLKQPDFGLIITLVLTSFMLLFITHINIKRLFIMLGSFVPLVFFLIYWWPYRLKRIATFLNPWQDPQGSGFQIIQSLIAIGSGSFWGAGISNSKQKFFYLPMQHTDFIFSIIAEETGLIGSLLLVMLYLLFLYFGLRIVWQLTDHFSMLATAGFVLLISLQALINIAVTTALLPTKGMGLPFVSYGNSALIANLCMVGLIINMVSEDR